MQPGGFYVCDRDYVDYDLFAKWHALPYSFIVRVRTDQRRQGGVPVKLVLVTNRMDPDADLIALAYRYRWTVELFFRWSKCILAVVISSVTVRMGCNCRSPGR